MSTKEVVDITIGKNGISNDSGDSTESTDSTDSATLSDSTAISDTALPDQIMNFLQYYSENIRKGSRIVSTIGLTGWRERNTIIPLVYLQLICLDRITLNTIRWQIPVLLLVCDFVRYIKLSTMGLLNEGYLGLDLFMLLLGETKYLFIMVCLAPFASMGLLSYEDVSNVIVTTCVVSTLIVKIIPLWSLD